MWPQYVYLGLTFIGLGIVLAKHGEIKTDRRHNFWVSLTLTGVILWILNAGGFFKGMI